MAQNFAVNFFPFCLFTSNKEPPHHHAMVLITISCSNLKFENFVHVGKIKKHVKLTKYALKVITQLSNRPFSPRAIDFLKVNDKSVKQYT